MSVYPGAQLIWQCHGCATLQGIRFLRQELAVMLVTLGMAPGCQQQLLLGISELMTNVVRHAKPSAHRIHLVLCRQHKAIWLQLEDDGGAFDPIRHAHLAYRTWRQGTRLRVSGYGLALLRVTLPALRYQRAVGTNRYSLPLAA